MNSPYKQAQRGLQLSFPLFNSLLSITTLKAFVNSMDGDPETGKLPAFVD